MLKTYGNLKSNLRAGIPKKAIQHASKTLKTFVQSTFKTRLQPLAGEKWMNLELI